MERTKAGAGKARVGQVGSVECARAAGRFPRASVSVFSEVVLVESCEARGLARTAPSLSLLARSWLDWLGTFSCWLDSLSTRAVPAPPAAAADEMDPDSSVAQPLTAAQLAPPGPALTTFPTPVPNYQDLTDESPSEDDEQDWDALVSAVERNFSEQQIDDMHEFLKERGLFAFLKEYLERRSVPPSTLLLAFGVMIVRPGRAAA